MAEKLFSAFSPVSTTKWEEVITKDLKGADYEKKLVWKTMEGINVRPYYRAEDLSKLSLVRSAKTDNKWLVRQDFDARNNVAEANSEALDVLNKGVDALGFRLKEEGITAADLDTLLENIVLTAVEINFTNTCCNVNDLITLFLRKAATGNTAEIRASIDYDPLRYITLHGAFCKDEKTSFEQLQTVVQAVKDYANFRTVGVGAAIFHNAGASIVQELAFGMAMGSEYMSRLTEAGISADLAAQKIKFSFGVGANYFMEMAKFRAARILWSTITSAYGAKDEESLKMYIHALTSAWNQTVYDPYVNMLRGTTESMSAVLAGVDSLEVLPFDKAFRKPSAFSNRIARNTQIILKEESYFDRTADPAAGSYYIETLTTAIAEEAWKLFKQIEEKGGYLAAFKAGFIQEQVKTSAQKREMNIATRREILLGTNQYPNFTEHLPNPSQGGASQHTGSCSTKDSPFAGEIIAEYRGAQAFEALRYATDKCGKQPQVFMLTFGNLAMCRARAQFSANFFACAGYKIVDNNRFVSIEEGVKAALTAKAEIVVACSSDDDYAEAVPQIAQQLGGKAILVVAGEPACKADLETKGIKNFISMRSNVLETLKWYQKELGI
ncbi:MAG: methylmalonyl-CoA mutase family protein [Prevotellaceae bacterium]|jgi:methylmalonyl-CoA mutase|nr:methylmalonyl-CoA mutase family protein [Prevotellaceae bacterium]